MADYLSTNWTEKIKTNPVANMILNGKKRDPIHLVDVRKILKIPTKGQVTIGDLYKHSRSAPGIVKYDEWTGDDYKHAEGYYDFMARINDPRKEEKKAKALAKARRKARKKAKEKAKEKGQDDDGSDVEAGLREEAKNDNENNNENIIDSEQAVPILHPNTTVIQMQQDSMNNRDVAARKGAIADNAREAQQFAQQSEVEVRTGNGRGNAIINISDDDDASSEGELQDVSEQNIVVGFDAGETGGSSGMWDNVYVDDFINIHHPKLRGHYIDSLTGRPVQIKPPSVFFSDM